MQHMGGGTCDIGLEITSTDTTHRSRITVTSRPHHGHITATDTTHHSRITVTSRPHHGHRYHTSQLQLATSRPHHESHARTLAHQTYMDTYLSTPAHNHTAQAHPYTKGRVWEVPKPGGCC